MELVIGSHVREHGNRVGRLAGFELEPANRQIRRIVFSPNGELGPQALTRPVTAVTLVHQDGEIELRPEGDTPSTPSGTEVVLLSGTTRLRRGGHTVGRLVGLDVNVADRSVVSLLGRAHWWSRRTTIPAADADASVPGEISLGRSSRAA